MGKTFLVYTASPVEVHPLVDHSLGYSSYTTHGEIPTFETFLTEKIIPRLEWVIRLTDESAGKVLPLVNRVVTLERIILLIPSYHHRKKLSLPKGPHVSSHGWMFQTIVKEI